MVFWFVRGLRRGTVTTRYPATPPDSWTQTLTTPPAFRPEALTRAVADELARLCSALSREGDELRYDVGACTACGHCLAVAPGVTIPSGEIELAATSRDQLVKRIPIRGGGP